MNFSCGRLFILIAFSTLAVAASAQDNPFNLPVGPPSKPPDQQAQPTAPPADSPATGTIVESILSTDPQTPAAILRAIAILLDLDRDDIAKQYLQRLSGIEMTDQQLFDAYRSAGPDQIFRIGNRDALQPEGSDAAQRILGGAQRFASDGARIAELLQQVVDDDKYVRSKALANLRLLGDVGAAALINLLVDDSHRIHWARIRAAIRYFGNAAEEPLLAALRSGDPKLRAEAAKALGFITTSAALESLYLPGLSPTTDPMIRIVARQSLERLAGKVPGPEVAETRLFHAAENYLMDRIYLSHEALDRVKWWHWDAADQVLKMSWLTAEAVARIRGFRRASDLVQLNPDLAEYEQLYWLARLETVKLTAGLNRPLPDAVVAELSGQISVEMLTDVLNASLDAERIPAAIAACELLAVGGNEELLNDGSRVSPLVRAVDFGAPRLAHAALATISRIDPHQSYTGSSRYISALIRMAQASGTRKVLVGHSNPQTAQTLGVVLGQSGLFPIVAGNSREFWDRAHNDPDIELLVLTDFINRPDFAELLQALKSSRQTRRIPVALMVGPENLERAKRVAARLPRVTTSRFVIDESLLARQVDNTMRLAAHRMPSSSERMEFAKQALVQLARIAENPNRYPFYNLVNHQDGLYSALGTPGLSQYACVVLGRIGTPRAQRSLLGIAGNSQLPAELRQVAAQSFANAVKNRGLMLTRNQILAQYDHYNASADESPENQQILGGILDAIEKKTN